MRVSSLRQALRQMRKVAAPTGSPGLTDAELLQRWGTDRDEAAFEVLVWRHGPMVLALCQRWLRQSHDIEDAFQATFFTLARKSGSVRSQDGVGGWLYRVAFRICLQARSSVRETTLNTEVEERGRNDPEAVVSDHERRTIVDEEVNRLPERYRVPLVLCYFQGYTNAEAAHLLGRPVGTILSRLATARERLRVRLSWRGLAPAAVASLLIPAVGTQAAVPTTLVITTVKAVTLFAAGGAAAAACSASAVAWTQGVLKAMFVAKMKAAVAVALSLAVLGTGGGLFGYRALTSSSAYAQTGREGSLQKITKDDPTPQTQFDKLQRELAELRTIVAQQAKLLQEQEERLKQQRAANPRTTGPRTTASSGTSSAGGPPRLPAAETSGATSSSSSSTTVPGFPGAPSSASSSTGPNPGTTATTTGSSSSSSAGDPFSGTQADPREALELLRMQVQIKQIHRNAAQEELRFATERKERIEKLVKTGAISHEEATKAAMLLSTASTKLKLANVELEEAMLRIAQLERRWKRTPDDVIVTERPAGAARIDEDLQKVENKLVDLLKEVQTLRAKMPRSR